MSALANLVIRRVVFPLWAHRDHPGYATHLEQFERTQFLPRSAIEDLQVLRLQKLLLHAFENCPFYQERMRQCGFDPGRLSSLEQVGAIPVLTKREIQDHGDDLVARNYPASARVRNHTGGSTGCPLQFYVDIERFDSRLASTIRHNRWAGYRPGDWCAELWGARLDQVVHDGWWDWCRNNFLYRIVALNTSSVSSEDWARFIADLDRKRPRTLVS
jgi:phenylacetate-CoA ligase